MLWALVGNKHINPKVLSLLFPFLKKIFVCFPSRGAGIWDFTMRPVELLRKIAKVGVYRFTGSIDAGGVPIHVEIITGFRFGRPTFAVGFAFDSESFGKLSEKLSGIGIDFLDAIGLELEVSSAPFTYHPCKLFLSRKKVLIFKITIQIFIHCK